MKMSSRTAQRQGRGIGAVGQALWREENSIWCGDDQRR